MKKTLSEKYSKLTKCRNCGSKNFEKVIDLGKQPVANNFVHFPNTIEDKFPLFMVFCNDCYTFQQGGSVDKKILFRNYKYTSSTSPVFRAHFINLAEKIASMKPNLVMEIGSNDGVLMHPLQALGVRVVGLEPAENLARECRKQGLEVHSIWIDKKNGIKKDGQTWHADVIVACNVFAHIDDIHQALKNVHTLLNDNGILIIEVAHLLEMVKHNYFDTIYHEHFFIWSLISFIVLLQQEGFYIQGVQKVDTHGGSLRIVAGKQGEGFPHLLDEDDGNEMAKILTEEFLRKLEDKKTYLDINKKIQIEKKKVMELLGKLRQEGKKVIGYGAPAKGNTLLNYFEIDSRLMEYIIDDAPSKQGLFTPGSHIEIRSCPEEIDADYIFILAWNFADSIVKKLRDQGYKGKFIIPFD